MTGEKIGVGIIGANPERGWAVGAHIPALRALPAYELRAVSTSRRETADAAGALFGVPAFDSHHGLLARDDIDLVVVSVKTPMHRELVTAAIEAGKAVYCEWPLGRDSKEAEALASLARARALPAFVGLQARSAPAVRQLRDLIAEGYVGEVLSTTLVASGAPWGDVVDQANAYVHDRANGSTMLSIPAGHTIDAMCWCLGEFVSLSATLAVRRPSVTVLETGEKITKTAADQIVIGGLLESGAVAAIHFRGGQSRGTNFLWEINGSEGDLSLSAANGHLQIAASAVRGGRGSDSTLRDIALPSRYVAAPEIPEGRPFNLGQAYSMLAQDLREGSRHCPTFDDAVVRHRMLDLVTQAAESGERWSASPQEGAFRLTAPLANHRP